MGRRVLVPLPSLEDEDKSAACLHPAPMIKDINPRWEIYKAGLQRADRHVNDGRGSGDDI